MRKYPDKPPEVKTLNVFRISIVLASTIAKGHELYMTNASLGNTGRQQEWTAVGDRLLNYEIMFFLILFKKIKMMNNWKLMIGGPLLIAAVLTSCRKEEAATAGNDSDNLQSISDVYTFPERGFYDQQKKVPEDINAPCSEEGSGCTVLDTIIIRPRFTPYTFRSMNGLMVASYFSEGGEGFEVAQILSQEVADQLQSGDYRLEFNYEDDNVITYLAGMGEGAITPANCSFAIQFRRQ